MARKELAAITAGGLGIVVSLALMFIGAATGMIAALIGGIVFAAVLAAGAALLFLIETR